MSSLILSLEEVGLSFGGKPLFEGLNLHLQARDRVCLIGRNGAGKTTLMKLITADLEPDTGRRFQLPGTQIGYLPQKIQHDDGATVKDYVLSGLPKDQQSDEHHYLAEMVISPLGLNAEGKMQPLSGGQKRRAALARALVMDPDILLLDEPTNHLDLQAIEWLEGYLQGYRGVLLCISHDRKFLANVSRKVFWLDRGSIKVCPQGYAQFEEWQEQQIEQETRSLRNLQKKVEAEHDWTQGGVSGRRKRNVRRLRELDRLRQKLRQDKAAYQKRSKKISMDPLESPNASKVAVEFKHVSLRFGNEDETGLTVLDQFNHMLLKGDRLGIFGANGSGKSTFLKLMIGELESDSGYIFRSKTLDFSYFDQHRAAISSEKTVKELLCPNGGDYVYLGKEQDRKPIHVCGYLKRFLFDPTQVNDGLHTLSGGQQSRLLLAKTLATPGNLLILDEPTNDLDMETLDMLQEMLAEYDGTLVIVSHDRDFLDRTVTEVLAFEGQGVIHNVIGGYSDYVREYKAETEAKKLPTVTEQKEPPAQKPQESATKTLTYGERLELKKLPEQMEQLHAQLDVLQGRLDDTGLFEKDPHGFQQLIAQFDAMKTQLEETEERWLELEEKALAEAEAG